MGKKRISTTRLADAASSSPQKARRIEIPSVADMGTLNVSGKSSGAMVALDDRIHVGLYEYMGKGSLYSETFSDRKVWVALFGTTCQPNPLYQIRKMIELFGQQNSEEDSSPQSLKDIEKKLHFVHQFVGKNTLDQDDIGWIKNRVGFYIDEEFVKEFFMYFDDLMAWRQNYSDEHLDRIAKPIEILIHMEETPSLELTFDKQEDELKCVFNIAKEKKNFMSVFDMPPPIFPGRLVVMTFELLASDRCHIVFSGNTKPFQKGFEARGIKGASVKTNPGDAYGEYFRVLEHVALTNEEKTVKYLQEIVEEVMQESPMIIRMKFTDHDPKHVRIIAQTLQAECARLRVEM
jgi:hypothetical protein